MIKRYFKRLKAEFKGYNAGKFGKDVLAGITVAAVALPLALAFGISSGATAAAGLITALIAGVVIGLLSGASYQISGPTGAMAAILCSLVATYQIQGVFIACFMSGAILLLCGIFKLGGLVQFIPTPVITGFTSGIAIIIAFGQINNLTGLKCEGASTIDKIVSYFNTPQTLNFEAIAIGVCVIVFMLIYPKKLNAIIPSSLMSIIIATALNFIFNFNVGIVGEIPQTLLLNDRLDITAIDFDTVKNLIFPAISIAALGLIESLLCGASAGRMKNEKLDSDQELVAQGIGNMLIPFFGGVPATAAIARTSVAIKSGAQTRIAGVIHSLVLLASMFLLGGVMSKIPMAALAGVLIVTAWRMNEFAVIKDIFGRKIKTAMFQYLITMAATVIFDLTVAIIIGILFSVIMFVLKVSDMTVNVADVDPAKIDIADKDGKLGGTKVVYVTGPLYFGTSNKLSEKLSHLEVDDGGKLIFSMRGVPIADISGVQAMKELCDSLSARKIEIYFSCVQPAVDEMFHRCGLIETYGEERFFWSTDKAMKFIAGETEHHALVAGTGDKFIGFRTGLGLQGVIHTQGNIGRLLVDVGDNAAGISIEAVLGTGVADVPDHLTGNLGNIHIAGGGDLTHNVNHTGGAGGLTGDTGLGVLGKNGIQNGIRDLVTDLIGMAFCYRFGCKQILSHRVLLPFCQIKWW